jgi:hypothetical protein
MKKLIPALEFPTARGDPQSGYTVHGRWFDDPYAWLERLDDPETQAWIAAQEAVTHSVLSAVPGRDWLRAAVARSRRYAQLSPPIPTGPNGREFLWQADASDEKLKFMLRRGKDAPLETVLDPNTWANDEVLVFAVPSPDGTAVAFGKSVGGANDAVTHVLDVDTGRLLPDRPRGTWHESLAWLPDGSGFFYAAYPEPDEVPAGDESQWHAVYEHRLGSGSPAQRIFGDDRVKRYWCAVEISECRRFAVLYKWDFVHANAVYLLRLDDDVLVPVAPDMRSVNYVQVIGDKLLVHTDLDAPRGRLCVAPLTAPTEWRTLIPESADTLQTVTGVGGRLYAVYSQAASHRVRVHAEDGTHLRELALPALGSVNHTSGGGVISGVSGAWNGDPVWVDFTSYVQPPSVYRYDYEADRLTPYHAPDVGVDASAYVTDQVWYESRDGNRGVDVHHPPQRPSSRRTPSRASERLRRLQHLGAAHVYSAQRRLAEVGRRARLPQHPRRRRIRSRLARGGSQDAPAERLRRLHRSGALARLGGLHDALQARLTRQQQRRSARCRHRDASTGGLRSRLFPRAQPRHGGVYVLALPERRDGRIRLARRSRRGPVPRRIFPVSQRPSRSPLSDDGVRAGVERSGRAAARFAQDGCQASGRGNTGRALFPAAAPGFGTRWRHNADGAHRTRRRRAQLLLLGARRRTALARRGVRRNIGGRSNTGGRTVSHPGVPGRSPIQVRLAPTTAIGAHEKSPQMRAFS